MRSFALLLLVAAAAAQLAHQALDRLPLAALDPRETFASEESLRLMALGYRNVVADYYWLRAISHYRAEITASPNFAYDLCVARLRADQMQGVDLSSWKIILIGAEPIRAATIEKFIETFSPPTFSQELIKIVALFRNR